MILPYDDDDNDIITWEVNHIVIFSVWPLFPIANYKYESCKISEQLTSIFFLNRVYN